MVAPAAPLQGYPPELLALMTSASGDSAALLMALRDGMITLPEWYTRMAGLLGGYYQGAAMLGLGVNTVTPTVHNLVKPQLANQLEFLRRFRDVIGAAQASSQPVPWEQFQRRAQMYTDATATTYFRANNYNLPLPAYPKDGTSQCLSNCKCYWEIIPIDAANGDYDCYWRLQPAEHCQTCDVRAKRWNPLRIRDLKLVLPDYIRKETEPHSYETLANLATELSAEIGVRLKHGTGDQSPHGNWAKGGAPVSAKRKFAKHVSGASKDIYDASTWEEMLATRERDWSAFDDANPFASAFLLKNGKLRFSTNTQDHVYILQHSPAFSFGLTSAQVMELNNTDESTDDAISGMGVFRMVFVKRPDWREGGGIYVSAQTDGFNRQNLRRLQRAVDDGVIPPFKRMEWMWNEGKHTREIKVSLGELLDAKFTHTDPETGEFTLKESRLKGGAGSGNFQHQGIPGHWGGSAARSWSAPLPDSMQNSLDGGPGPAILYHGSSTRRLVHLSGDGLYLTTNPDEAEGYARGKHRLQDTPGSVYAVRRSPGKTANINPLIEDRMSQGEDPDDVIQAILPRAKRAGFRYLYFEHPAFQGDAPQQVLISLYPEIDLRILQEARTKGGPGSGNYQHAGIPGHQGGSAPARNSGNFPLSPDRVGEQVGEHVSVLNRWTEFSYFLTPDAMRTTREFGLAALISPKGEIFASQIPNITHWDILEDVVKHSPEKLDLPPGKAEEFKKAVGDRGWGVIYNLLDDMLDTGGWTRVRFTPRRGQLAVQTGQVNTSTLRRLQKLYENYKLPPFERLDWDTARGSNWLGDVRFGAFLNAHAVRERQSWEKDRFNLDVMELKEYRLVREKHLGGQHDQSTHGNRGGLSSLGQRALAYMKARGWEHERPEMGKSAFLGPNGKTYGPNQAGAFHASIASAILHGIHVNYKDAYSAIDVLTKAGFARIGIDMIENAWGGTTAYQYVEAKRPLTPKQKRAVIDTYQRMSAHNVDFSADIGRDIYMSYIDFIQGKPTRRRAKGGPGSGNYGHAGIPGHYGGSAPGEGNPNFRRLFGQTKVVDEQGRPREVFHGTFMGGFEEFDEAKQDEHALYGPGFYFTEDREIAVSYMTKGATSNPTEIPSKYNTEVEAFADQAAREVNRQYEAVEKALEPYYQRGDMTPTPEEDALIVRRNELRRAERVVGGLQAADVKMAVDLGNIIKTVPETQQFIHLLPKQFRPKVYGVYLSIKHPFDVDKIATHAELQKLWTAIEKVGKAEGWTFRKKAWFGGDYPTRVKPWFLRTHKGQPLISALHDLSHPRLITTEHVEGSNKGIQPKHYQKILKAAGYDGITHIGGRISGGREHRVWIAFKGTQIKSPRNSGGWSPAMRNIYQAAMKGGPGSGNFGHAGIPGHYGGSAPQGLFPSARVSAFLEGKIQEAEAEIAAEPYEHAVFLNSNGEKYFTHTSMSEGGVFFDKESMAKINSVDMPIAIHNHPNPPIGIGEFWVGTPPSLPDVQHAWRINAKEMRVVAQDREFIIRPKNSRPGRNDWPLPNKTEEAYNASMKEHKARYILDMRDGTLTVGQGNYGIFHTVWEEICPQLGLEYIEKPRQSTAIFKGGPGSGNRGHAGIPGHHGGSAPQGGSAPSHGVTREDKMRLQKLGYATASCWSEAGKTINEEWYNPHVFVSMPDGSVVYSKDGLAMTQTTHRHTQLYAGYILSHPQDFQGATIHTFLAASQTQDWDAVEAARYIIDHRFQENEPLERLVMAKTDAMSIDHAEIMGEFYLHVKQYESFEKTTSASAMSMLKRFKRVYNKKLDDPWQSTLPDFEYLNLEMPSNGAYIPRARINDVKGFRLLKEDPQPWEDAVDVIYKERRLKGGPGSGNFGHAGIPGHHGGSAPGGFVTSENQMTAAESIDVMMTGYYESDSMAKWLNVSNTWQKPDWAVCVMPDGKVLASDDKDEDFHTRLLAAYALKHKDEFDPRVVRDAREVIESGQIEDDQLERKIMQKTGAVSLRAGWGEDTRTIIIKTVDSLAPANSTNDERAGLNNILHTAQKLYHKGALTIPKRFYLKLEGPGGREVDIRLDDLDSIKFFALDFSTGEFAPEFKELLTQRLKELLRGKHG